MRSLKIINNTTREEGIKYFVLGFLMLPVISLFIGQSEWFWRRSLPVQIALLLIAWLISIPLAGFVRVIIFKTISAITRGRDFWICVLLSFLSIFFLTRTPLSILPPYALKVSYSRYFLTLAEIGLFILIVPVWYLIVLFSHRVMSWLTSFAHFLSSGKSLIKPSVWLIGILPALLLQTQLDSGILMERVRIYNQNFVPCSGLTPYAYCTRIDENWMDASRQINSRKEVLENGEKLTYPNSLHEDIAEKGQGRYSIWGTTLYMSAADNSNPGTNQHVYEILRPRFFPMWFLWTAYILGLIVTLFSKPIPAKNLVLAVGWLSLTFGGLWKFFPSITWFVIMVLNLVAVTTFWRSRSTTGNWSRQNFWIVTVLFVLLYFVFRENW